MDQLVQAAIGRPAEKTSHHADYVSPHRSPRRRMLYVCVRVCGGCLTNPVRKHIRRTLDLYVFPPEKASDMRKGNKHGITLPEKRRHDWAGDCLRALDFMESKLRGAGERTGVAPPVSQQDEVASKHWFYRTWLPRMVKSLMYTHHIAAGDAGLVRKIGKGKPGPRAHRPDRARPASAALGSAAAPASSSSRKRKTDE